MPWCSFVCFLERDATTASLTSLMAGGDAQRLGGFSLKVYCKEEGKRHIHRKQSSLLMRVMTKPSCRHLEPQHKIKPNHLTTNTCTYNHLTPVHVDKRQIML